MRPKAAATAQFNAWIARDADAILATLALGGADEDTGTCGPTSGEAMKSFFDGRLASAGYTTVWTLHGNNGFMVRCDSCRKMTRHPQDGAACACGAPLPAQPAWW
jgi:hypothetical protein